MVKSMVSFYFLIVLQCAAQVQGNSILNPVVQLKSGQVSIDNPLVSVTTTALLEIFRVNTGPAFQPNQCFELYVASPYLDPTVY
jgi:hypothetical protein